MHSCQNSLGKPYTEKRTKHTPSGYSLLTNCSFDVTKNKLGCYKGEDCMKGFCKGLRDHAVKIINYEEKEMHPYEKQKVSHICKEKLVLMKMIKMHLNYTMNHRQVSSSLHWKI